MFRLMIFLDNLLKIDFFLVLLLIDHDNLIFSFSLLRLGSEDEGRVYRKIYYPLRLRLL
jgi:hypothetical protein